MGPWPSSSPPSGSRRAGGTSSTPTARLLDLAFESLLMEVVADFFLVLQQPVDARLMTHCLADHLGGRFTVDVEERSVVQLAGWNLQHGRIEPHGVNDPQVIN